MSDEQKLVEALAIANEDRALLRRALADANRERKRARNEQQQTERWLRHLEHSRSWKLTQPLRGAGTAWRSISRRVSERSERRV